MGIEDAKRLRLLAQRVHRADVQNILQQAESVRRPRTAQALASTLDAAERVTRKLEFNCRYNAMASMRFLRPAKSKLMADCNVVDLVLRQLNQDDIFV